MATVLERVPNFRTVCTASYSFSPFTTRGIGNGRHPAVLAGRCSRKSKRRGCLAMVQQTVQGASASYAKEMERLSAKESLLLALRDEAFCLIGAHLSSLARLVERPRVPELCLLSKNEASVPYQKFQHQYGLRNFYSLFIKSSSLAVNTPYVNLSGSNPESFKDSGGLEALVSGKTTDIQRIDVNERITGLERLNPTPRPTTSPYLEGQWSFQWFGAGSPGLFAARFLFERFPTAIANLLGMDVLIKDSYSKATANLKFLNTIDSKVALTTKLSVEGPLRIKEEYVEGIIETPSVNEDAIPEQLKGVFGQATGAVQQLPSPIKESLVNGLRIPLGGTFQRMFMISYLDEEILIVRDTAGVPDVLTRLDGLPFNDSIGDYES